MENHVSGIRDVFYRDLIKEYRDKSERSLLYRHFWAKGMEELLKTVRKGLPKKTGKDLPEINPENRHELEHWLRDAMQHHPEAVGLLQKNPPARKERRDFWKELWLWDACYQAGRVTDTEYYVWLVGYLDARDEYYKDTGNGSIREAHVWLYPLLQAGLRGTEWELAQEKLWEKDAFGKIKTIRTKTQVEGDLRRLAELLQSQRGEGKAEPDRGDQGQQGEGKAEPVRGEPNLEMGKVSSRLHGLKKTFKAKRGNQKKETDYLPWLTLRLKRTALHIKVKTWLQDSGYPYKQEGEITGGGKAPRKQDFSMQLLDAYMGSCYDMKESGGAWDFIRKGQGGGASLGMWQFDGKFCTADQTLVKQLAEKVQQCGKASIYIPLGIHVRTGCIFFLAGSENYHDMYEQERGAVKGAYGRAKENVCCCFDYLRLEDPGGFRGELRMQPCFHENAGKDYGTVLGDFKRYCETQLLPAMEAWNEEAPPGIPPAFLWAFDEVDEWPEEPGDGPVSREAKVSWQQARDRMERKG